MMLKKPCIYRLVIQPCNSFIALATGDGIFSLHISQTCVLKQDPYGGETILIFYLKILAWCKPAILWEELAKKVFAQQLHSSIKD